MAARTKGAATTAAPAETLAAADPITAALAEPLDPRRVATREGSGRQKLSYLKAHDVKRTANRIFGHGGWGYVLDSLDVIAVEPFKNSKGREGIRVGYRAAVTVTVRVGHEMVHRGDVGYGDAMEYNGSKITPHELAAKEAVSDALKRCLASFGDQFGLCLYGDDPAPAEPEAAPAAPSPVPMAPKRLFQEMGEKCIAAGFDRNSLLAACKSEKDAHGGYRMSFVVDLMATAEKALKSAEGEA